MNNVGRALETALTRYFRGRKWDFQSMLTHLKTFCRTVQPNEAHRFFSRRTNSLFFFFFFKRAIGKNKLGTHTHSHCMHACLLLIFIWMHIQPKILYRAYGHSVGGWGTQIPAQFCTVRKIPYYHTLPKNQNDGKQ